MCCGTGGKTKDLDTFNLLAIDISDITDVAGAEAYQKCGFDSSKIK
jgi:hypothetical protein